MADEEEEVKFKKHDLDRLGIFSEMSYLSGEIPQHRGHFRILAPGGRMRSGITKSRSGNQDGYFRKPFPRIFEGDGHVPRIIRTREQRKEKDRIDKSMIRFQLPRPSKKHSTPGDFHGTFFTEPPQAMDPRTREKPERPPPLLNFFTRPGKKGGPGFVDITISKYPEFIAPKKVEEKVWMTKEERKKAAGIPFHTAVGASRFFTKNPYRMDDTPRVPLYVRPVAGKTKKQVIEEAELRLTEKKEEEKEVKKKKKKKSPPIFLPVGPARKCGGYPPVPVQDVMAEERFRMRDLSRQGIWPSQAPQRRPPMAPLPGVGMHEPPFRGPFRHVPRRLPQMMPGPAREYFERDIRRPFEGEAHAPRRDRQSYLRQFDRVVSDARGRPVPPMRAAGSAPTRRIPAMDPRTRRQFSPRQVEPFRVGGRRMETFGPQPPFLVPAVQDQGPLSAVTLIVALPRDVPPTSSSDTPTTLHFRPSPRQLCSL